MATRVILDTGALGERALTRIRAAADGLDFEFRSTSVSDRELELATRTRPLPDSVPEMAVVGQGRVGAMVVAGNHEGPAWERALWLMSGGGFPKPDRRDGLSEGNQSLLRDAIILATSAGWKADMLVTTDTAAFGQPGSRLRKGLEALYPVQILTVDEFCTQCERLRSN